jgi:hypothetical protein
VRLNTLEPKSFKDVFRRKIRAQILNSFRAHLSHNSFCSFEKEFNKNRKALQIEQDVAPFTEDKQHSWTRDRLPDIKDVAMNSLCPDRPAAASIPAPCGATQLPRASVPGSASTAALLPAGPGQADGSGDPVAPPASPPLTGLRRPRAAASPPASDKPKRALAGQEDHKDHCGSLGHLEILL